MTLNTLPSAHQGRRPDRSSSPERSPCCYTQVADVYREVNFQYSGSLLRRRGCAVFKLSFRKFLMRVTSPACGRGRALRPGRGSIDAMPFAKSPLPAEGTAAKRWSASDLPRCAVEVTKTHDLFAGEKGQRNTNAGEVSNAGQSAPE